jgi:hypothetical protein
MQELVNYNLPPPHQHVEAPVPESIPAPPKFSTASPTPSKKPQAKATPKAPGKRRRKASLSPAPSPSSPPIWTDEDTDFYLGVDTDQGTQILDHLRHSILDILNWYYPTWKTHQHLDVFTNRSATALPVTPHPDTSDTGLVVRIQSIPRGHPFYSPTLVTIP